MADSELIVGRKEGKLPMQAEKERELIHESQKSFQSTTKSPENANTVNSEEESEFEEKNENVVGASKPTTNFIFENEDGAPEKSKKGGRRKINIEFIENKSRRHVTFSKRKTGLIKKAYELSTLTGTQVLLLIASETGNVYTFATPKLQPVITHQEGKQLIQKYLNPPDVAESPSPLPPQPSSRTPSPTPSNVSVVQPARSNVSESHLPSDRRNYLEHLERQGISSMSDSINNFGGFSNFRFPPTMNNPSLPPGYSNFLPVPRIPNNVSSFSPDATSAFSQVSPQQLAYLQRNNRQPYLPLGVNHLQSVGHQGTGNSL